MQKLPVIFRAERAGDFKGDVTAVFPTLPADYEGREMVVYAHVGQHSGGSFGWYLTRTRAAYPVEYADLLAELRSIYGNSANHPEEETFELVPYRKITNKHREAFRAEVRRQGGENQ